MVDFGMIYLSYIKFCIVKFFRCRVMCITKIIKQKERKGIAEPPSELYTYKLTQHKMNTLENTLEYCNVIDE